MSFAMIKRAFLVALMIVLSFALCAAIYAKNDTSIVFRCNAKNRNKIALTFDDGPHPKQTEKILTVLEKYGVKATFFTIGVNIDHYGEALNKVADSGHEIGNHTDSHSILKSMPKDKIKKEIENCQNKIKSVTNTEAKLIRPPCGLYDDKLIEIAKENGQKIVLWNIDTNDWAHKSNDEITKNVVQNVKGGDIILFHDYISGKNDTVMALERIIPILKEKGYEFVTVSELLKE